MTALWMAELETRNFYFMAFGDSPCGRCPKRGCIGYLV